ncbi:MAG: hypothetical protein WCY79_03265, partial [Bacteroidales bacterium]
MNNCLFCYQPVKVGTYHSGCSKKFFGTTHAPVLEINREIIRNLAENTVNKRLALTGVQPKISLTIEGDRGQRRLTLVGLWGEYILKPQSDDYAYMPEVEDLTIVNRNKKCSDFGKKNYSGNGNSLCSNFGNKS